MLAVERSASLPHHNKCRFMPVKLDGAPRNTSVSGPFERAFKCGRGCLFGATTTNNNIIQYRAQYHSVWYRPFALFCLRSIMRSMASSCSIGRFEISVRLLVSKCPSEASVRTDNSNTLERNSSTIRTRFAFCARWSGLDDLFTMLFAEIC